MNRLIPYVSALAWAMACVACPLVRAQENVVIVLDDSGSMNERMSSGTSRMEAAKNAIAQVLQKFPEDTKLGLFLLNGAYSKQHWAIPLGHLSVTEATRRVKGLKADGGTPLGDRIREASDSLLKLREKQIYGTYRLLVVTDGEATDAKQLAAYLPDVLSRGIIVDAIGVDMKQDHSLATRVHSYRKADDAAALASAVQEVFAERVDGGTDGNTADYELLEAIDNETAVEALRFLSKPNNGPILGLKRPDNWQSHPTGAETTGSNSVVVSNTTRVSLIGIVLVAIASCAVPLFLLVSIFSLFVSRRNRF